MNSNRNVVCLMTGASSGIGKEAAHLIAAQGARVVLVCRDAERGKAAQKAIIQDTGNRLVDLRLCDLASQRQIRRLAESVLADYPTLNLLINNAGVMKRRRELTEDGIETTFAVNHLAPFLLTNLLSPRLIQSAPSRVVTVSSAGHFSELMSGRGVRLNFDDLNAKTDYDTLRAYSRSKLANVLFTYELARRLEGSGVVANCLHPGSVRTRLGREMPLVLVQMVHLLSSSETPRQGGEAILHAAMDSETARITGKYFDGKWQAQSSTASYDRESARRLWEASAALTKL